MAVIKNLTHGSRLILCSFCYFLFSLFFSATCLAQSPFIIDNTEAHQLLDNYLSVYEDKTGTLSFDHVRTKNFTSGINKIDDINSAFLLTDSTFWLKFTVKNASNLTTLYLKNNIGTIEYFDLYEPIDSNNFHIILGGLLRPKSKTVHQGKSTIYPLFVTPGTSKTYFIKIKSRSAIGVSLDITSKQLLMENERIHQVLVGAFWGIMLTMLFVNLLCYLIINTKSLLFLSCYILATMMVYAFYDGLFTNYEGFFSAKNTSLITLSINVLAIAALYYCIEQLLVNDKQYPFVKIVRRSILIYWCFIILLAFFTTNILPYQLHLVGVITLVVIGILYSTYLWYKQLQQARFICIGLFIIAASHIIPMMHLHLDSHLLQYISLETSRVGVLLLVPLLGIAVVDYLRNIAQQKKNRKQQLIETNEKFKKIIDQSQQMFLILSPKGTITSINRQATTFLQLPEEQIVGNSFPKLFSSLRGVFDQDSMVKNIDATIAGNTVEQTIVVYDSVGSLKDLEITYQPFIQQNKVGNVIVQIRDISKQNRAFKAIQDMVVGIAGLSSENFFKNFLIEISRIYGAKYVIFSELNNDVPLTATTISMICDNQVIPNFSYAIKDTPCELLRKKHLCNYPANACELFPNDEWLNNYSIQSYLGVSIKDPDNNIIGFLSVMDDKPMNEDNYFIEVLDVFAARISNELREQESQMALKTALEKLDFHISNTPLGVIEWDAQSKVTKWNKAAEKIFGFKLEHFKNKNPIDVLVPKQYIKEVKELSQQLLNNQGGRYSLNKNLTFDGEEILCEWYNTPLLNSRGDVIGVASLVNDVTAEHNALNALYNKENEQREIFNALYDAVLIVDVNGNILNANNTVNSLFDYTSEELIGKNIETLIPENQTNTHITNSITYYLKEHSNITSAGSDLEGQRKSGEHFPIHVSLATLPNNSDTSPKVIITCHDLTEFRKQQETLKQSQKMDALGNLTGGIAHDFNNLLGIMNGYSELLASQLSENSKQLKYAQHIQKAAQRGAKLTRKLLSFASKNVVETEQVDINEILFDDFEMLQKTITPRINLTYSLYDGLPVTQIDKGELEDCILNLSINAMHAIPKHGEITITTSLVHVNDKIAKRNQVKTGEYIQLSVTDDGVGMDKETQQKAMEPFFTTKGNTGTGLGLSQVYGFADRSQGCLQIDSAVGKGTTVSLFLPVVNQTKKTTLIETYVDKAVDQNRTILIVDDEPSLVDLSNTILTHAGYHVLTAYSAKEALKQLESSTVDAILCDIIMPIMDGIELASIVKELYPHIKILFVSGYHENDAEKEQHTLIKNLLKKPYNSQELLHQLAKLLNNTNTEKSH